MNIRVMLSHEYSPIELAYCYRCCRFCPSHARSIIISVIIINAPILLHAIKSRNFQFNFKISNSKLFCRIFYRAFTSQSGGWLSKTMPMLTMLNQPNQTKSTCTHTKRFTIHLRVCSVCVSYQSWVKTRQTLCLRFIWYCKTEICLRMHACKLLIEWWLCHNVKLHGKYHTLSILMRCVWWWQQQRWQKKGSIAKSTAIKAG